MSQASHEFKGSVDFNQNELRNATFQRLTTPPISPIQGQIYYNTPIQVPFYWNENRWLPFGIPPIHKMYLDNTYMFADQSLQIEDYIYYVQTDDIYYQYLGTTDQLISDYHPIGGAGSMPPEITASNGLTKIGNDIQLGDNNLNWVPGTGLVYNGDWEDNFTPRTLVTQQYLTSEIIANAYVHPSFTPFSINTSGSQILDEFITTSEGHVSGITFRNLTLADLGYTGDINANNYIHPSYTPLNPTLTNALVLASIKTDSIGSVTDITTRILTTSDINAINIDQLGVANGIATLDSGGKLVYSQIPDSLLGGVIYQGQWNAATDTPTLPDPTTVKGHYYIVQTAGTYLGISYNIGDWIISDGLIWDKVDNTDAVTSVYGRIGNVVALATDYNTFYVRHDINSQGLSTISQGNARANIKAQITITGGASTITTNDLIVNRALISNNSGKVAVSTVTAIELEYLSGVTSSIQTQLNNKLEGNEIITLTGDITGSGATSIATTISNNAVTTTKILDSNVTYSKIQNVSANRILGQTSITGVVKELTPAEVRTIINVADGANNYIHPTYTAISESLNGALVLSSFTSDSIGSVTGITTRSLTLLDLGFTGDPNSNNYIHPNHSGDIISLGDGATTIQPNVVTDTKIRQSVAYSVIGRFTGTTGNVSNIVAGVDSVLRRSGSGDLTFGALVTNNIGNSQITYSKIQNVTANRLLGRLSTTGVAQELSDVQIRTFLNIENGANNYIHPSKIWEDKITLSGATVISNLTIDSLGHPTNWTTRELTPSDIGAQVAGSYVPTNRTITINGVTFDLSTNRTWSIPLATATVAGLVELFSDTVQTTASNAISTTTSRTYGIQLNSSGQMVVNVPWTNTVYTHPTYTPFTPNLTGANVLASLVTNTIGSVTALTTRILTPADISAEPSFNKGSLIEGAGVILTGTLSSRLVDLGDLTISHANTSSIVGSFGNKGISAITIDRFGHITSITTNTFVKSNATANYLPKMQDVNTLTDSLFFESNGNMGLFTTNPIYDFHILKSGVDLELVVETSSSNRYASNNALADLAGISIVSFGSNYAENGGSEWAGRSGVYINNSRTGQTTLNKTFNVWIGTKTIIRSLDTGETAIGQFNPTAWLDVGGDLRVRSIANAVGNFATYSATGVLQQRTASQVLADIGAQAAGDYVVKSGDTMTGTLNMATGNSNGIVFGPNSFNKSLIIGGWASGTPNASRVQASIGNLHIDSEGATYSIHLNYYHAGGVSMAFGGGNVAVGTANTSYKLGVTGTGYFSEALTLGTQATVTSHAVRADRTIVGVSGLKGGGDLTGNRSLSFDTTWGDSRYFTQSISDGKYMYLLNGANSNDVNTLTRAGIWRNWGGTNGAFGASHTTLFQAGADSYGWQLAALTSSASPRVKFRAFGANIATEASDWVELWHSGNFDPSDYQPVGNYVTGTGAAGQVAFWDGVGSQAGDALFTFDGTKVGFGNGTFLRGATGGLVIAADTNSANTIYLRPNGDVDALHQWLINSSGTLQANSSRTIQTSPGDLTLATGGNGNINLNPDGIGGIYVKYKSKLVFNGGYIFDYDSTNKPDITALTGGSVSGLYFKANPNSHFVIGIDGNDGGDSFAVLAHTATTSTDNDKPMNSMVFQARRDGSVLAPAIWTSPSGGNYIVDMGGTTGFRKRSAAEVLADIGAQPTGSYAPASHMHPASQITAGAFGAGIYTMDILRLGGEITASAAKLQVNGFMRTGTIYLHEGDFSPTVANVGLSNISGNLFWGGNQVWHQGNHSHRSDIENDAKYVKISGGAYIQSVGRSSSWGSTNGTQTGAFNAVMGTSASATWLLTGTSNGVFRAGIQALDNGGAMRIFVGSNYMIFDGSTLSNVNLNGNAYTVTKLQTARTINGTAFDGSANIVTDRWGAGRNITIGDTVKLVDGSSNVSWTLAQIGAQPAGSYAPASHDHPRLLDTTYLTDLNSVPISRGELTYSSFTLSAANKPVESNNANGVISMVSHSGPYGKQLAFADTDDLYIRRFTNNNFASWRKIWHDGNFNPAMKENSFSKNTAFNKNFGTVTGTVVQGDDPRINNGQTAYAWGNHATVGYILEATANNRYSRYIGYISNLNTIPTTDYVGTLFSTVYQPVVASSPNPATNYLSGIQFRHGISQDYRSMLVMGTDGDTCATYVRNMSNGSWGPYHQLWHSGLLSNPVNSVAGANKTWTGTQASFNAISTKDSNTIYFITT